MQLSQIWLHVSKRRVKKFKNLAIFLQHVKTGCLNVVIPFSHNVTTLGHFFPQKKTFEKCVGDFCEYEYSFQNGQYILTLNE